MTAPVLAVPTENGRYYTHPARRDSVPSITNILGKKFKPLWSSGAKAAAQYAAEIRDKLGALDEEQVFQLVSHPPFRDDSPSAIGDLVHKWIEEYVRGGMMGANPAGPPVEDVNAAPNTAKWMYGRFLAFVNHYQPQFTDTEFTVWSNRHGYAGTADLSFKLGETHILADTKTGKAVYPEAAMQLAALANADVILSPDGSEKPVPKYDRFAVLHLRPRSFTLHPVDNLDAAFEAFLHLKGVFDWDIGAAKQSIGFAPPIKSA